MCNLERNPRKSGERLSWFFPARRDACWIRVKCNNHNSRHLMQHLYSEKRTKGGGKLRGGENIP